MTNLRCNMQPVSGTLRYWCDGVAAPVVVALYGYRIVVRGDAGITGVPITGRR
jgi:hypothetical protein